MLIGIDASRAVRARRTGTENYSLYLIRSLAKIKGKHRLRLYLDRNPAPGLLPRNGVEWRIMPFPRLWTHLRLSLEMGRHPPDVLFVPAHVIPLVHPPASVVTIHDLGYLHYPWAHPLLPRLYLDLSTRWSAHVARRIIADSQATRRDLMAHYGVEGAKIAVVYPGYDRELFRPVRALSRIQKVKARYGIVGDYMLYVGTLQPRKNLKRLVKAFAKLEREGNSRGHKLVIAGGKGWLYEPLFAVVRKLGLEDRVVFTGFVAQEDLPALYSGATLFVYPSLHEGFGLPVLEAMACGTPVVCSDRSSLPEVAGDAALFVNPLHTDEIASAISRLLADGDLRAFLVERGLRRARQFSWERCARRTLSVLESALGGALEDEAS